MASVNKVIIVGNLGKDPDFKVTPSGQPVANFSVATTDRWNDKSGQKQERTEWHRIVLWGRLAEIANQYLKKGRPVYIEGRLQTRSWEKDGIKRDVTEIVGNSLQLLGSRRDNDGSFDSVPSASAAAAQPENTVDDDLPF